MNPTKLLFSFNVKLLPFVEECFARPDYTLNYTKFGWFLQYCVWRFVRFQDITDKEYMYTQSPGSCFITQVLGAVIHSRLNFDI